MPRIFMSILGFNRAVAFGGKRMASSLLTPLGAFREKRKQRQYDEVLNREDQRADDAGQCGGQTQVRFPKAGQSRAPELPAMPLRRDAHELAERVIHVKHFVVQDFLEY